MSTWTKLIKQVLSRDPDAASGEQDVHPGPLVELDFWDNRAQQLSSICDQLQMDRIQATVKAVEQAQSTYAASFRRSADKQMRD